MGFYVCFGGLVYWSLRSKSYIIYLTCTDENGLGTGIVRYRFNNVRYTIPGFFRDMHKASPYRCNRPFGVCKPLLTLLIWCVLNPGYLIYIVTNTDAKIQKYLHPTAGMRQKSS